MSETTTCTLGHPGCEYLHLCLHRNEEGSCDECAAETERDRKVADYDRLAAEVECLTRERDGLLPATRQQLAALGVEKVTAAFAVEMSERAKSAEAELAEVRAELNKANAPAGRFGCEGLRDCTLAERVAYLAEQRDEWARQAGRLRAHLHPKPRPEPRRDDLRAGEEVLVAGRWWSLVEQRPFGKWLGRAGEDERVVWLGDIEDRRAPGEVARG